MVRTQMYPTDRQRTELEIISKTLGKKQSELIREAVDRLIDQKRLSRRESALREAAGIWKDREDLPDFRAIRSEWDFLFTVVPVTTEIARAGSLYKREYAQSHGAGFADAIIAATCESENAVLKTLKVKGLKPAYKK